MGKTKTNLEAAFAGESQASRKYFHFAIKADQEGHAQVAKLFRAAAYAETVHAGKHLKNMGGIGDTAANLETAIKGEHYEVTVMYPDFLADAQVEGESKAEQGFKWAWEVEKTHEQLYMKALELLGKAQEDVEYYVCSICGHTHVGTPPEKCPVCGAPRDKFVKMD
ncbi:MAG: rubrerythrin [Anaerolinea sp.]|nr:rubrerythrin [Anaerolinea sp.]